MEPLEQRLTLSTFTVLNDLDSGEGSLLAAVNQSGKYTPTFSGLSSPTITYGAAPTEVSGTLNPNGGPQMPPWEVVSITIYGVTQDAHIDSYGHFTTTFDTRALPVPYGLSYTISFAYAGDSDFESASATSTFTVNPKALTVTADNRSKTYGTEINLGTTAFTTSGLINGDTVTGVTFASSGATATAVVNTYSITASNATGYGVTNYTIAYTDGTLTVDRKALSVTADNRSKTYGSTLTLGTTAFTTTGLANSDSVTGVTLASTGVGATAVATTYAITATAATGTGLDNYTIGYADGTLTVDPKALTITAGNRAKTYGSTLTLGTTAFTTSGLINGDTVTGVTLASSGAAATAAATTYAITPSAATGTGLGNYTITYVDGALTVLQTVLIIMPDSRIKTYGTELTLGTTAFTAYGLLNGDTVTGVTLASSGAAATAPANFPYLIYASAATGTGVDNYIIVYNPNVLTVNPKALTVTADDRNKTYGSTLTLGTTAFTTYGLVNGDTVTGVTLASSGVAATSAVTTYAITASAATGPGLYNYTIGYADGTLTVNRKSLTVTADDRSKTYGATLSLGTTAFTTSGLVNSDTVTGAILASSGAAATAAATTHAITASAATGTGLDNYTITYSDGTLTVDRKALTVTADDRSKTYGTALSLGTTAFTTSGLINGDTVTGVTFASSGAAAAAAVTTYSVTPSAATGTGVGNYTITYNDGTLTVDRKALTITANSQSMARGAAVPPLTASYTGFVNGDTPNSLTTKPTLSTTATSASGPGAYPITVGGAASPNYTIGYVDGVMTVTSGQGTAYETVDPLAPTQTMLCVSGTSANDVILVNPGPTSGSVTVTLNKRSLGTFAPPSGSASLSRIVVHGLSGDDYIGMSNSVTLPAWLYGDAGNDQIWGGGGANLLMGGAGNNTLWGGNGRSLLIGGAGKNSLLAGRGDAIQIGGTTDYDTNDRALLWLLNSWNAPTGYQSRVAAITNSRAAYALNAKTAHAGRAADALFAGLGNSLYFQGPKDAIRDKKAGETVVRLR